MFPVQFLIWLALGGLLQLFGFGKWMIPAAAWLVPVFLLHFARGVDPLAGALGIWLVLWIAIAVANQDVIRVPRVGYFGVTALIAALAMLAYLADRLIAPHLPGFTSTLVFPLAWVTIELVNSRANPLGTWGAVAYTQYGNLPLMQLASVIGIWGIAFLINWFGSVVNWAWANNFNWTIVQNGVLFYAGVFGLVMLWGGARIAFASSNIQTVRIAGIGWPRGIIELAIDCKPFCNQILTDLSRPVDLGAVSCSQGGGGVCSRSTTGGRRRRRGWLSSFRHGGRPLPAGAVLRAIRVRLWTGGVRRPGAESTDGLQCVNPKSSC
jgi:hypothetical protein